MVTVKDIFEIMKNNNIDFDLEDIDHIKPLSEQGFDSLDIMSLLFSLEEKYDIKFNEDDIDEGKLGSLNEIISFMNKNLL